MTPAAVEWLEADGLGGFASGTSALIRTRRYHGLLLVATTPPTGRVMLVNRLEAWVDTPAGRFALSAQRYAPGLTHPDGLRDLAAYASHPWPAWTFTLPDGTTIVQELFVPRGAPRCAIAWRLRTSRDGVTLRVRPLLSGRDYHATHRENGAFRFEALVRGEHVTWHPYDGLPPVTAVTNGTYEHAPDWYRNFLYEETAANRWHRRQQDASAAREGPMLRTLRDHWPEYLMEAGELALFMVAAGLAVTLLDGPTSPVRSSVDDPMLRRLLIGLLMGATAVALVHSPWGRQSGAHMNPALTLTFLRLGRIAAPDAACYAIAQFIGASAGIAVAAFLVGPVFGSPEIRYVATTPGAFGAGAAFAAEMAISFALMTTVLAVSNTERLARFTPWFVGVLIAVYITVEAPLSGMSMNPARTLGPATFGRIWDALWIYFTAPPLGMLLAAEAYVRVRGARAVRCAKLHHANDKRCIFRCGYRLPAGQGRVS